MFKRRRGRSGSDELVAEDSLPDQQVPEYGPFDESEAPDDGLERLDLGSVRVPVPEGGQLQVEVDPSGPVRAVHLVTPVGRLTISAFAAPRSKGLWGEVSSELAEQLRRDGASVRTEQGEWGPELVGDSQKAALRFVGVDGPRWLLRGVAAGPPESAQDCTKLLYDVVSDAVVVRGDEPMPVRTPLPIELPEAILRHIQQAQEQEEGQAADGPAAAGPAAYGQAPNGQY